MLLDASTVSRFVVPKTWHDPAEGTNYQTCVDEATWAVRRDALNVPFPYPIPDKGGSWWTQALVHWSMFRKCESLLFLSDERFRIENPVHREYPSGIRLDEAEAVLNANYPELGPWSSMTKASFPKHRCEVQDHRQSGNTGKLSDECSDALESRFQAWFELMERTNGGARQTRFCGGGIRGVGICRNSTLCCSKAGWCGTSKQHCK